MTINAAQILLQAEFHHIGGFQNTVLSEKYAIVPETGEFFQILNNLGDYWVTISNIGCKQSISIRVFDSLAGDATVRLVADLLQSQNKFIMVKYEDVPIQNVGNDCGSFP